LLIDIVNLQRKKKLNLDAVRAFVSSIAAGVDEAAGKKFAIAFVSDRRMKQLNEMFRGKNTTTDVLSFPHEADEFDDDESNLGDIVISVEQAEKQAKANKLSLENEISQLILHGFLHLSGYDHETDSGEMNERELELRKRLSI
jgi:probable rRNA maturation factor